MYNTGRKTFIGPVCSMGRSGLIISICIIEKASMGSRFCRYNIQCRESKPYISKVYRPKNRLCKFNALQKTRGSCKLQPFLFAKLILNIKKLKFSSFQLFCQCCSKPSSYRSSYCELDYFELMPLLVQLLKRYILSFIEDLFISSQPSLLPLTITLTNSFQL